jgi:hypothetical protein
MLVSVSTLVLTMLHTPKARNPPVCVVFVKPLIKVHKEYGIVTSSYGGLLPLFRAPGEPLDPVIEKISARFENMWGRPVTSGQVLNKWLLQHDILVVTYVFVHCCTVEGSLGSIFQDFNEGGENERVR